MARALRWDGLVLQTERPDGGRERRRGACPGAARAEAGQAQPFEVVAQGTTPPDRRGGRRHRPARRRCRRDVVDRGRLGARDARRPCAPGSTPDHPGYPEPVPKRPIDLAPPTERAFLIAVDTGEDAGWTAEESLAELASLADTAGAEVVGAEWQNRRHVDPNWYLGKGKAEELVSAKAETGFTLLIADDELKPNQQKSLEALLGVKVLDRSGLILDIFAQHARTHEGRLQVELAQLEYQLPRLTRLWTHLSRTQGGIGIARTGREPAGDRPAHHPDQDQQAQGAGRGGPPAARDRVPRPRPAAGADGRHRGLHQRRQVARCSTRSRARRPRSPRTGCSRRSTPPAARSSWATASRPS